MILAIHFKESYHYHFCLLSQHELTLKGENLVLLNGVGKVPRPLSFRENVGKNGGVRRSGAIKSFKI